MTNAQNLMEKMGLNVKKSQTLTINGVEFTFNFNEADFSQLQNDITGNKGGAITAIKDYLLAIVAPENKADLLEIINVPDLANQVAMKLNEVFLPKLEISLKA